MYIEVEGARSRKTCLEVVKNDMKGLGLASADFLDRHAWRRKTVRDTCLPRFLYDSSQDDWAIKWCVCVTYIH